MAVFSILITSLFFKKHLIFPKLIQIQILRSSFLFLSTIFFFYAISIISMAEAITLSFISPIIATILSFVILKEKVGPRRWIAVLTGFVGVLFVIRPGFNEINLASLAAVGAGICYAFYLISTRKLSATDNPLMTLIFTGFTGCIVISLIVPFFWTSLSLSQWVLLISLAAIGTMAHFLIILSLRYAEASKLAPLGYSEIIMNVIIGYYFFGDFPDQWIWIGLIIIVASGIYISLRETKKTI
jgi:drug/metabolite transporter (DMT)-like permease